MFSAFAGAFFYDLSLANYIIPSKSQDAMQWAKMNTPDGSRFIVLTGRSDPFSDPSAVWFPVYADRTSQNTIQGREWLLGKNFAPFLNSLETLQNCLNDHPSCIANWAHANQLSFEYLFIEKNKSIPGLLLFELRSNTGYTLVFENEGAAIFERK
ncbi:MAG: hypothetical protein HY258_07895 [Chloroflexi bacterium]|nr:hypothetical protein [Chloroflexota bacterium]